MNGVQVRVAHRGLRHATLEVCSMLDFSQSLTRAYFLYMITLILPLARPLQSPNIFASPKSAHEEIRIVTHTTVHFKVRDFPYSYTLCMSVSTFMPCLVDDILT